MKRYLYLFLLAALAWGCNDSDDSQGSGSGSETQQPVSPDEILPRRLVTADVTLADDYDYPFTEKFSYDEQGRLVSIVSDEENGYNDTDTFVYGDNTIVAGETTYRLQNGRAVSARVEEPGYPDDWMEITFGYDARGYLVSLADRDSEGSGLDCTVTYASNGISIKCRGDKSEDTLTIEYDRTRLNNLNIDLYGDLSFSQDLADIWYDWGEALLLSVGGERLRYLPATVTVVSTYEEEGERYTDKGVVRYVYHMDGDYLSEVEIYTDWDGEKSDEPTRIAFHYE